MSVTPTPAAKGSVTIHVEARPATLGTTRALVRQTLSSWQIDDATANAVIDVAHELVSNAIRHGGAPITLQLDYDETTVNVQVSDGNPQRATLLPYRAGVSERGIGLRLVDTLSNVWGQTVGATGKVVWAQTKRSQRAQRRSRGDSRRHGHHEQP